LAARIAFGWPRESRATDCQRATDQVSLNMCAEEGLRTADQLLNETYQSLLRTISPEGALKLKAAEHAWLAYCDTQCTFETFSKDGSYSAEPMVRTNCLMGLTELHTKELEGQQHCEEGIIGCRMQ
jgi:uncharacterized protein YecT (DUF1311 family)